MNEEEKIAFNFYKGCNENDLKRFDDFSEVTKKQIKYTKTLLNLIEKQQKEIENRLNEIKCLYNFISIREERIDELVEINEKYKELLGE